MILKETDPVHAAAPRSRHSAQQGGVTILVALLLLVFLTVVAAGMTRNSFREIITSGTARQAAMARNVADSGVEWSLLWLVPANVPNSDQKSAAFMAGDAGLAKTLLQQPGLAGQYFKLSGTASSPTAYTGPGSQTMPSDMTVQNSPDGVTQGFTLALMLMGHLPQTDSSQGISVGSFRPAAGGVDLTAPDLWSVRSDGQVTMGGVTFRQSREAWISTPTR
jgi:hypothetical protein